MKKEFQDTFNTIFESNTLTEYETEKIQQLLTTRYQTDTWNKKR